VAVLTCEGLRRPRLSDCLHAKVYVVNANMVYVYVVYVVVRANMVYVYVVYVVRAYLFANMRRFTSSMLVLLFPG